jgi:hypothetical protein
MRNFKFSLSLRLLGAVCVLAVAGPAVALAVETGASSPPTNTTSTTAGGQGTQDRTGDQGATGEQGTQNQIADQGAAGDRGARNRTGDQGAMSAPTVSAGAIPATPRGEPTQGAGEGTQNQGGDHDAPGNGEN